MIRPQPTTLRRSARGHALFLAFLALGAVQCSNRGNTLAPPTRHRAQASACMVTPASDASTTSCAVDADCATGATSARFCVHGQCNADQCVADADCPSGGVCSCKGDTFGYGHQSSGNVCVAADCRTDADCAAGFCSPTVSASCGAFYGVQGYHCHASADTCSNDTDCPPNAYNQPGYCAFRPEVGHWACGNQACAG